VWERVYTCGWDTVNTAVVTAQLQPGLDPVIFTFAAGPLARRSRSVLVRGVTHAAAALDVGQRAPWRDNPRRDGADYIHTELRISSTSRTAVYSVYVYCSVLEYTHNHVPRQYTPASWMSVYSCVRGHARAEGHLPSEIPRADSHHSWSITG
jgi:hypothetical protein